MKALWIGASVEKLLETRPSGQLLGASSRGLYLLFGKSSVIYLTQQPFHGPLTVNVDILPGCAYAAGDPVNVERTRLTFPIQSIELDFRHTSVWHPPPRPKVECVRQQNGIALAEVFRQNSLLAEPFNEEQLQAVKDHLQSRDLAMFTQVVENLLGRGPGLTPCGDDWILGILLSMNRWREPLFAHLPIEEINRAILPAARRKTTALSACLIECACQGEADERLVSALDALVCGEGTADEAAALLNTWGNTSGRSALVGMLLALACAHYWS